MKADGAAVLSYSTVSFYFTVLFITRMGIPHGLDGGFFRTLKQGSVTSLYHERFMVTVIFICFCFYLQYQTPHTSTKAGHVT